MLYLVSVSSISAGDSLDGYENFIVEADNDKELATAIANVVIDCEWYSDATELDTTCWNIRELGDSFEFQIFSPKMFDGKRL